MSNDDTREALIQLGFRYHSSAWEINAEKVRTTPDLLDLPISGNAADFNLFDFAKMSDADVLRYLYSLYAERSLSGRPLVILLHPHVMAAHADVFHQFVSRVGVDPQNWGCFRDWLQEIAARRPERRGLWVDTKAIPHGATEIVEGAQGIGITDLFVQVYEPEQGPIFGEGRPHDDYFHGILDEARRCNIRVHAWFPICFDAHRLGAHPEWGMMDSNGQLSDQWVCPTNAVWREELLAMYRNLLDHYGVDGIHLDYIRFPNMEVCRCPTCRANLSRRAGVNWPLDMNPEESPERQAVWWNYRADLIRELTSVIAARVRESSNEIQISASLKPEGAVSFDGVRQFGQSYEDLSPLLDFITPMAYHQLDGHPVKWVQAVEVSGQWRAGSTPVWIGIQAYEEPSKAQMSLMEFGALLESVRKGSPGVALYSYAPLFSLATENDARYNMPKGAAALVQRWSRGLPVGSDIGLSESQPRVRTFEAPSRLTDSTASTSPLTPGEWANPVAEPEFVESKPRFPQLPASWFQPITWSLAGAAVVITLQVFLRILGRKPKPRAVPDLPLSVLETLALEPVITGPQAEFINLRMQRLQPAEVERIRGDALLLSIEELGGSLPIQPGSTSDSIVAETARRAGLIDRSGDAWRLTADGAARVAELMDDPHRRDWIRFVESRIAENLTVTCPSCGTCQQGHWMRPTLGCPSCHRRFQLTESAAIIRRGQRRRPGPYQEDRKSAEARTLAE